MQASISSSNLSDTQQTNESLEDTTKSSDDLDTKPRFNHSGNKVHHKSPKLSRQQALVVADVHSNTITSSDC